MLDAFGDWWGQLWCNSLGLVFTANGFVAGQGCSFSD